MYATGEIQLIPIGAGISVREEVQRAHRVIAESGLKAELHANGTNVEGELELILGTVARIHEVLHAEGAARLVSYVKVATRTDKQPTLAGKLF
ncbi:MAG: MTH1187 family thiamine-binding protein [Gemmatimonadales bacterium]